MATGRTDDQEHRHPSGTPSGPEFASQRKLAGYSQTAAAALAGIDRSSLQAYESGRLPTRGNTIAGLAKAYAKFVRETATAVAA